MFEVIFSKFSNERDDKFKIKTLIGINENGEKLVKKIALTDKSKSHIQNMAHNINLLSNEFVDSKFKIDMYKNISDEEIILPYVEGKSLTSIIDEKIKLGNLEEAYNVIADFYNELKSIAVDEFKISAEFKNIFGDVSFNKQYYSCTVTDIDMIFDNIIVNKFWNVIDAEWTFDFSIPIEFVIYRAIIIYNMCSSNGPKIVLDDIFNFLGISKEDVYNFSVMEQNFSKYVNGKIILLHEFNNQIKQKQYRLNDMLNEKQTAMIYFNYGNGYSENAKTTIEYTISKSMACIDFSVELPTGVKSVRFDPIENKGVILCGLDMNCDNSQLSFRALNGIQTEGVFIFKDNDPQIEINFNKKPNWIKIKASCIFFDSKFFGSIYDSFEILMQVNLALNDKMQTTASELYDLQDKFKSNMAELNHFKEQIKKINDDIFCYDSSFSNLSNANSYDEIINSIKEKMKINRLHYETAIAQRDNLNSELQAVLNSTIWKLTKPLRMTVNIIKMSKLKLKRTFKRLFVKKAFSYEKKSVEGMDDIEFCLENLIYKKNVLIVEGWMFSRKFKINNISLLLCSKNFTHKFKPEVRLERMDVYNVYKEENSKNCGFKLEIEIGNFYELEVYLDFDYANESKILNLGYIQSNFFNNIFFLSKKLNQMNVKKAFKYIAAFKFSTLKNKLSLTYVDEKTNAISDMYNFIKDFNLKNDFFHEEMDNEIIDIIIPIYNGFDFLTKLLPTIKLTNLKYNIIFVEDKSTDDRILPYIKEYAAENNNVFVIENETNLGFVKSVNKCLAVSKNHKVLLNTDVELPALWLERLVYPFFIDKKVASTTPYTNSGTICSFPNIKLDNELFGRLSLNEIDDNFKKIKPKYTELPTGVGFCFGMNKNAISAVGLLDEKNFGQGYGEENDWCQRAKKHGFKNVQVENLFVYHKHGASFSSDTKKELINKNTKVLLRKHPNYEIEVSNFFKEDPNKSVRDFLIFLLSIQATKFETILVFDHNIGGGATKYLDKYQKDMVESGYNFIMVRYNCNTNNYLIQQYFKEFSTIFKLDCVDDIQKLLDLVKPHRIIINELVTYPAFYEMLRLILDIKERYNSKLIVLIHDYYFLCPSYTLINDKGQFCYLPSIEKCEKCIVHNKYCSYQNYLSVDLWRKKCKELLLRSDEITVFSNDSKKLIEKIYGYLPNISIKPHTVNYVKKISNRIKTTSTVNIGLLGMLGYQKGLEIVKDMLKIIEKQNLNVKIVLIGSSEGNLKYKNYIETGKYTRDMLTDLVLKNEIDIFFIASICPETFSYTTQEIIEMDMPVASFDIGAPAERIKKYDKGLIIKNISAENALNDILDFLNKN